MEDKPATKEKTKEIPGVVERYNPGYYSKSKVKKEVKRLTSKRDLYKQRIEILNKKIEKLNKVEFEVEEVKDGK